MSYHISIEPAFKAGWYYCGLGLDVLANRWGAQIRLNLVLFMLVLRVGDAA